ncbi:Hpt domain-containing protein [Pseudomonas sp. O230]|uniref:Hpt domain-containing protein n=1 Tax=Pseudomonas sp. O230 TaxID=3159450 RepID=UPI00387AFB97
MSPVAGLRWRAHLAHSLRGTAGNIGASAVTQAAAELEQLCQIGSTEDQVEEGLIAVERCLALLALMGF